MLLSPNDMSMRSRLSSYGRSYTCGSAAAIAARRHVRIVVANDAAGFDELAVI